MTAGSILPTLGRASPLASTVQSCGCFSRNLAFFSQSSQGETLRMQNRELRYSVEAEADSCTRSVCCRKATFSVAFVKPCWRYGGAAIAVSQLGASMLAPEEGSTSDKHECTVKFIHRVEGRYEFLAACSACNDRLRRASFACHQSGHGNCNSVELFVSTTGNGLFRWSLRRTIQNHRARERTQSPASH